MDAGERQCPVCSAVFATDAALGSHLAVCVGRARAEAKRPPPRTEDDVDDARGRVLCYVCGQRVLTPASLAPHLKKCERARARRTASTRPRYSRRGRPSRRRRIHMTLLTSGPGTSPLDRPSRRRCRSASTAIEGLRASRRATPTRRAASALLIEV